MIIAKVWLIGRVYAAAIERRKNAKKGDSSDHFYETTVAEKIRKSDLDELLSSLPNLMTNPWRELAQVVTVHKELMKLFAKMTGLKKRALASKYLHFHRPDLFFIYDSRAKDGIATVTTTATPTIRKIIGIQAKEADREYLAFVRRCQWIRDDVRRRWKVLLTPRQLDKILLRIADENRKRKLRVRQAASRRLP